MNREKILEKIYAVIDIKHIINIFFGEIRDCFSFYTAAFYLLQSEDKLKIAGLKLPADFEGLISVYQDSIEINVDDFSFLKNCLEKNETLFASKTEIEQEKNAFTKRIQFFDLEDKIKQAVFFPISDNLKKPIGILMLSSDKELLMPENREEIQNLIRFFIPAVSNALKIKELIEKQAHIEKITLRYQRVLKFITEFNQLLELKTYFEILTKEMNSIFGFEVSFVQLEKEGKLPICYGSAVDDQKQAIFEKQKDYFSFEKNAPLLKGQNGPEMACCLSFLNHTYYYVQDAKVFFDKKIDLLEKDRIALEMMGLQLKSFFQIPFSNNKNSIGILQMWNFSNNVILTEPDIEMIRYICSFVPSVFENISVYALAEKQKKDLEQKNTIIRIKNNILKEEIKLAAQIQQGLIPSKKPSLHETDFAFIYKPMEEMGGDFFDFIQLQDENSIGIFISDVSGHGVPAALITSMIKTLLKTGGENHFKPAEMLSFINKKLSGQTGGNFLTAFYGIYNFSDKSFTYSRGGHNPPYLIRNGKIILLESKGKILGLLENLEFEEKTISLKRGDKILFYTDGLTEAVNPEAVEFEEKIEPVLIGNALIPVEMFVQGIYKSLLSHKKDSLFEDDVCLIGMEIQ